MGGRMSTTRRRVGASVTSPAGVNGNLASPKAAVYATVLVRPAYSDSCSTASADFFGQRRAIEKRMALPESRLHQPRSHLCLASNPRPQPPSTINHRQNAVIVPRSNALPYRRAHRQGAQPGPASPTRTIGHEKLPCARVRASLAPRASPSLRPPFPGDMQ